MLSPTRKLLKSPHSSSQSQQSQEVSTVNSDILPISSLSRFSPRNWKIKAKCTFKSNPKEFQNKRTGNSGTVASVDLIDNSGEIRITMYTEQVETFFPIFEVGKVYTVSHGNIRPANKHFCKSEYEAILTSDSKVVKCSDEDVIQTQSRTFLENLDRLNSDRLVSAMIDIIGVVHTIDDLTHLPTRNDSSKTIAKKTITLIDDSNTSIAVNIWGPKATTRSFHVGDVVECVNAVLTEKGADRNISISESSEIIVAISAETGIDQNSPSQATQREIELFEWYKNKPAHLEIKRIEGKAQALGPRKETVAKTVKEITTTEYEFSDQGDFVTVSAVPTLTRRSNVWYMACPNEKCKRKLPDPTSDDPSEQNLRCHNCSWVQTENSQPHYRYLLSVLLSDHTGSIWATAFDNIAPRLIGMDAASLAKIHEKNDDKENVDSILLHSVLFAPRTFTLRIKKHTVDTPTQGSIDRLNVSIVQATEQVDTAAYSNFVLGKINEIQQKLEES
ncbi:putative Replication protein A 70 kDa DNA-binding subunit [Blattamonas nauphoetae]|uniref:Replication protein A 70 kDa DNA-binding subunit n=1 Tax=Blattamonas nauphoetae TaxID=2049346 RepID=A0ABQ9WPI0_9EUKA|nr:putative Replication protein A 70 kDa DNA-binding subunit [Blattamonas nauphoetae]